MATVIADFLVTLVVAVTGIGFGWWVRGGASGHAAGDQDEANPEVQRAREILGRLHDLAARVAADVGEHSHRVEEINEELSSADAPETEVVVGAVSKLLQANEQMQQQLVTAENRLRDQARQIQSHATEARTDALTGLANRRALDAEMARRFADFQQHGKLFCLVMIDVDLFKKFNDTHGHQAGDDVLRGVASVLRKNARSTDFVARYGGEEFAVVLPAGSEAETFHAVERLRQAIDQARFRFQGTDLHVTASLGLAGIVPGEGNGNLVKRADEALYASKKAGRNCAHFHDGREIRIIRDRPAPQTPPAGRAEQADRPSAERGATTTRQPQQPESAQRPRDTSGIHPGLPNRTAFCTVLSGRLAEWRRGGAPPAALLIRVDRHAEILARRGPQAGSLVMETISRFLFATIREMDLVAQYDTDAFAMLLPGAELQSTIVVADRLRQAIAQCAASTEDGPLQFTVSVGGAETLPGDDTAVLLSRALEALDAASKSGGNCCYFHNGQWSETMATAMERAQARQPA